MTEILIAVLIITAVAVITGIGLSVASNVFAVPKNEKEEKIRECLPGANCGACGYSGCDGYASALASGKEERTNLCGPGGDSSAEQIASVFGKKAEKTVPLGAVVLCNGGEGKTGNRFEYSGIQSCKGAVSLFGGPKSCTYGCLGYGDCVKTCPYGAIEIDSSVAHVDTSKCKACKKCISVCPKGIISLLPKNRLHATVLCSSCDKGADTHKSCSAGCIGCGKCAKTCTQGAIEIKNFLAYVDPVKCIGCGECEKACPKKCIRMQY